MHLSRSYVVIHGTQWPCKVIYGRELNDLQVYAITYGVIRDHDLIKLQQNIYSLLILLILVYGF